MSAKICKRQRRGIDVTQPELCGTLPECLERAGINPTSQNPAALRFTVRWYRGQMRAWAGWWRDSLGFSFYRRDIEPETAARALFFAVMYRQSAERTAAELLEIEKNFVAHGDFTPLLNWGVSE
jgi:hypothetical protein